MVTFIRFNLVKSTDKLISKRDIIYNSFCYRTWIILVQSQKKLNPDLHIRVYIIIIILVLGLFRISTAGQLHCGDE